MMQRFIQESGSIEQMGFEEAILKELAGIQVLAISELLACTDNDLMRQGLGEEKIRLIEARLHEMGLRLWEE